MSHTIQCEYKAHFLVEVNKTHTLSPLGPGSPGCPGGPCNPWGQRDVEQLYLITITKICRPIVIHYSFGFIYNSLL